MDVLKGDNGDLGDYLREIIFDGTQPQKDEGFISLKNDYVAFIKEAEEGGIRVKDIFLRHGEENEVIFDCLITLFNNHIEVFKKRSPFLIDTFEVLYEAMQERAREENIDLKIPVDESLNEEAFKYKENYLGVALMLHLLFDAGYIRLENGKLGKINIEIDPSNVKDVKRMKTESEFGLYEGVVSRDGKLYMSRDEHEVLMNYLLAIGVQVGGGLRINQSPLDGEDALTVSSLWHFGNWCPDVDKDEFLKVTNEQAKTLVEFLATIKNFRGTTAKNALSDVLRRSSNLGFSLLKFNYTSGRNLFDLGVAKWNLLTFEEVTGGDFNAKEMREKVIENYRIKIKEETPAETCNEALLKIKGNMKTSVGEGENVHET